MIAASPKMLSHILLISTLFAVAFASGQLSIVHFPKSLAFKGTEPLAAAALGDVFAAASGASIEGSSEWSALSIRTPFDLPRGNFLLYLQGAQHSPIATKNTYELTGAGSFESVTNALNRVTGSDYTDLAAGTGDLEKITWTALKPESRPDEKAFLQAIASLYALTEQLTSTPTADLPVFWAARLQSSQSLTTTGSTVSALAEAKKIEAAAIDELIAALKKSYGYDVLIAVAASDETDEPTNVRHKRQATPDISENHVHVTQLPDSLNAAEDYDDNYPVIFNILLWFGIVMFFTLVAISYTIGNMDPGRDSIIYRMTSTRMKKDN